MKKLISFCCIALLTLATTAQAGFEVEPNDRTSDATVIPLNEVMKGAFPTYRNSSDYYRFTLTAPRADVTFHFHSLIASDKYARFYLYDVNGKTLYDKAIALPYSTSDNTITQNLTAGTFIIKVCSTSTSGSSCYSTPKQDVNYELSVITKVTVPPSIVDSASLPDLNENGSKDIALLRILKDASVVAEIRDGNSGEVINTLPIEGESLKPISVIGFDNGNVGVLVYDNNSKAHTQYIFNANTGEPVTNFNIE